MASRKSPLVACVGHRGWPIESPRLVRLCFGVTSFPGVACPLVRIGPG